MCSAIAACFVRALGVLLRSASASGGVYRPAAWLSSWLAPASDLTHSPLPPYILNVARFPSASLPLRTPLYAAAAYRSSLPPSSPKERKWFSLSACASIFVLAFFCSPPSHPISSSLVFPRGWLFLLVATPGAAPHSRALAYSRCRAPTHARTRCGRGIPSSSGSCAHRLLPRQTAVSTQPQTLGAPNADSQGKGVPGNGADGCKPSAPPGAQWPSNVQKGQYAQMSGKGGKILNYPPGGPTGPNAVANRGAWRFSLCACCSECDSCCESWCCEPCQLSRQCNMLVNNRKEIHWPYCLLMTFCDYTLFVFSVSCIFASETRRLARERYGISGSSCEDCCLGYFCRPCSTQQVLLEMTLMNEFPGATCYETAPHPAGRRMV